MTAAIGHHKLVGLMDVHLDTYEDHMQLNRNTLIYV
jgi:hypothetical protein